MTQKMQVVQVPAGAGNDDLRPVRSETRRPRREHGDRVERPYTPEPGDNAMAEEFRSAGRAISNAKAERKGSNDIISAALIDLEMRGIPREVTKLVLRIEGWDVDKREAFDLAYVAARAYAEMPLQADMFRNA